MNDEELIKEINMLKAELEKTKSELTETKEHFKKYYKNHKEENTSIKNMDVIAGFVSEKIRKTGHDKCNIKKKTLLYEFKDWLRDNNYKTNNPKSEEIYEYMKKNFGSPHEVRGWVGLEIVHDDNLDIIDELL